MVPVWLNVSNTNCKIDSISYPSWRQYLLKIKFSFKWTSRLCMVSVTSSEIAHRAGALDACFNERGKHGLSATPLSYFTWAPMWSHRVPLHHGAYLCWRWPRRQRRVKFHVQLFVVETWTNHRFLPIPHRGSRPKALRWRRTEWTNNAPKILDMLRHISTSTIACNQIVALATRERITLAGDETRGERKWCNWDLQVPSITNCLIKSINFYGKYWILKVEHVEAFVKMLPDVSAIYWEFIVLL